MRVGIVVFPGSNCDRDLAVAFENAGARVKMIWHKESDIPDGLDLIGVPGGFSFGDYLRCGAIAAQSPVCRGIVKHAERGGYVLGVCNGFQVLTETGLLPGALMRNSDLKFVCREQSLKVETTNSAFTSEFESGQGVQFPIAHHDGNYTIEPEQHQKLKDEDRIAFRYVDNPNGSVDNIAGVLSNNRRVLGLMPHPERSADGALGGVDGSALFTSLTGALEHA